MNKILLKDYRRSQVFHEFDLASGVVATRKIAESGAPSLGCVGFGDWRRLGLRPPLRRVFVAVYALGLDLFLALGSQRVPLGRDTVTLRERVGPLARRFIVRHGGELQLDVRYWFSDWRSWPDNGDIFSYAERMARTQRDVLFAALMWKRVSEGQDIGRAEVLSGIDAEVESILAKRSV